MPGETVMIILDKVFNKSVPKPVNLRPGYDLEYVNKYQGKCGGYDYNRLAKMIEIERRYDDLSIIRPRETPQGSFARATFFRREYRPIKKKKNFIE